MRYSITSITEPAEKPVSVAECRDVLEIDGDDHDNKISIMLSAAISEAEHFTSKYLSPRTVQLSFDDVASVYRLPIGPVSSIVSVETFVGDSYQPFIDYINDLNDEPPLVRFLTTPSVDQNALNRVRFTAQCGYQVSRVPDDIKQAIMFHVYQSFLNRGDTSPQMRKTFRNMLQPYRLLGL